jgi:hypothetical protein
MVSTGMHRKLLRSCLTPKRSARQTILLQTVQGRQDQKMKAASDGRGETFVSWSQFSRYFYYSSSDGALVCRSETVMPDETIVSYKNKPLVSDGKLRALFLEHFEANLAATDPKYDTVQNIFYATAFQLGKIYHVNQEVLYLLLSKTLAATTPFPTVPAARRTMNPQAMSRDIIVEDRVSPAAAKMPAVKKEDFGFPFLEESRDEEKEDAPIPECAASSSVEAKGPSVLSWHATLSDATAPSTITIPREDLFARTMKLLRDKKNDLRTTLHRHGMGKGACQAGLQHSSSHAR